MYNKIKYFFVFAVFLGLLTNCRKYRDDEGISFRTVIKRLTAHSWKLIYFGVDYKDSTFFVYGNVPFQYYLGNEVLNFYIDKSNKGDGGSLEGSPFLCNGWSLYGKNFFQPKSTIILAPFYEFGFRIPNKQKWDINKLTDKDFNVSSNYNNKNYEMYFTKK